MTHVSTSRFIFTISSDIDGHRQICFTICLFISSDLDVVHPSIGAVDGDQDRDVQNTRYGRTVRISTPQLPFVVSFPGQNAQLVIL